MAGYALERAKTEEDLPSFYRRLAFLGRVGCAFLRSRIGVVRSNLGLVFPEWSQARVRRVSFEAALQLCRGFGDLCQWAVRPEAVRGRVKVEGNEHLEAVMAAGSGFMLATGHVGVFPLVGMPVMWRGLEYGVVAGSLPDKRFADMFGSLRDRIGIVSIPTGPAPAAVKGVMKILRAGGGVLYTFDMDPQEHVSVETVFLGQKTRMFSAPVRIAARKRIPLLPCYAVREADGMTHRVVYCRPVDVPAEAGEADHPATRDLVSRLADWLSEVIRIHPTQWWWARRRWERASGPRGQRQNTAALKG
jgi:KDO2-lipid IV(A) lauroyltransferase